MTSDVSPSWSFNLIDQPWIDVARVDGAVERLSLRDALVTAHESRGLAETAPVFVAGTYRILVAVIQDALRVATTADIKRVWLNGRLPVEVLDGFCEEFRARFDLFAVERPFMQSEDLPSVPTKDNNVKPVGYLSPDLPTATAINHFRHVYDDDQCLCPRCAALGLITVPAFASSGGAGIRPSINGVPPLYVLPVGDSLFASLALGLIATTYQPKVRSERVDLPWWRRSDGAISKDERTAVGYLESLTFPARRVRLHPSAGPSRCMRCGETAGTVVRTMVFDMGESRPKDAAFWQDPFAAYRPGKGEKAPIPIRPVEGKALWREFATLFLPDLAAKPGASALRPRVVDQIDALVQDHVLDRRQRQRFRCIGLRTDMKAKVFEWVDSGFEVPLALLEDRASARVIEAAVMFAEEEVYLARTLLRRFGSAGRRTEHRVAVRERMVEGIWAALAGPFRHLILRCGGGEAPLDAIQAWSMGVLISGRKHLEQAVDSLGDEGNALRHRAEAMAEFGRRSAAQQRKLIDSITEA